jgi:hypothetical protein
MTSGLVPLADDMAKLQPPLLHLLGLGSHMLLGRRSLFSSRLRFCPHRHCCLRLQLIAERPKVLKLRKRGLERKTDRAEGLLRLQDTDTSLVTFRVRQLTLG